MRRKRNTSAIAIAAVSSAGFTGDLIEDFANLQERLRGSFAVILNSVPTGLHNIVVDSSLGELSYHFARKGNKIVFLEEYSDFLESVTGRLLLTGEATIFLSSYKDESPEEEILVSPGASREVRVWYVVNNGANIVHLDSRQGKRHAKTSFMSLTVGKTVYQDAWDIS